MNSTNWFEKNPKKTFLVIYIIFFLLIEIVLRLNFNSLLFVNPQKVYPANPQVHHDYPPNVSFLTKPSKFDTFTPAITHVNSFGIRGPELSEKKNYRVLSIGDSFIQAEEMVFENTFGERLNQYFKGKIEFISHGISSWSPTTEFSWIYHKGTALEPDEINLFLFINDFYRDIVYKSADQAYRKEAVYQENIPVGYQINIETKSTSQIIVKIIENIATIQLLYRGFNHFMALIETQDNAADTATSGNSAFSNEMIILSRGEGHWPEDMKQNVDETIKVIVHLDKFLKEKKIKLNILLVPLGFAWQDEILYGKQLAPYGWTKNFTLSQMGLELYLKRGIKKHKISWIDLQAAFEKRKKEKNVLLFLEADGHWSAEGHSVVYEVLKNYFIDKIVD